MTADRVTPITDTKRKRANALGKGETNMQVYNEKIVTLKLKRIDVCDLLLATTIIKQDSGAEKWKNLHDKLKVILEDFDKKNFKE